MDPHASQDTVSNSRDRARSSVTTAAASDRSISPFDTRSPAQARNETTLPDRSLSPTGRVHLPSDHDKTVTPDGSVSPTDRRPLQLGQEETPTPDRSRGSTDRRPLPLDQEKTLTPDRSVSPTHKTDINDLDKHPTLTHAISGHPHLEAIRTAAHESKVKAKQRLHLDSIHATGPSDRFNPTNVRLHIRWKGDSTDEGPPDRQDDEKYLLWRSRDNRKRRNSSVVPAVAQPKPVGPRLTAQTRETSKILFRMFTTFPYWDMAFWSGWSYTWGSALFIMDGSWAYMEAAMPGSVSESVATYGGPLCFFIGALLYQLGAVMAYLEAVNDGSFRGSAMRRFLEGHEDHSRTLVNEKINSFVSRLTTHKEDEESLKRNVSRRGGIDMGPADEGNSYTYSTWRWWPTWHMLKTHHVYEIGYVACTIQLFGATLYGICGVVALPGILTSLLHWQKEAAYWIPQIVASCCFLTASIMFTLENTEKWYRPEWLSIGWWIGIWAGVGSVGFLLLAIFGTMEYDYEWGAELADLTTIWASAAYLFSSFLQWYEAVDKREQNSMLEEGEQPKPVFAYPMPMAREDQNRLRP